MDSAARIPHISNRLEMCGCGAEYSLWEGLKLHISERLKAQAE
jgi:hypothetical protein